MSFIRDFANGKRSLRFRFLCWFDLVCASFLKYGKKHYHCHLKPRQCEARQCCSRDGTDGSEGIGAKGWSMYNASTL